MNAQQRFQQEQLRKNEIRKHLYKAIRTILEYLSFPNGKPMQVPRDEIRDVLFKTYTLQKPTEVAIEYFQWLAKAGKVSLARLREKGTLTLSQLRQTRTFIEACLWVSKYLATDGRSIYTNRASKTDTY